MTFTDYVNLIRHGIPKQKGVWADLGSGEGTFTLALASLTHPETEIFSVDKHAGSLRVQQERFKQHYPQMHIHFLHADFTKPLDIPLLDGIIMANSLHFLKEKVPFLQNLKQYLKANGRVIIVEYNTDTGNAWVPYPFSFQTFQQLAHEAGFTNTKLLNEAPSEFLGEMYGAVAYNKGID